MSEWIVLLLSLCGGFLLGIFFFGGLRWTVHKALASSRPGLLFFFSMQLRVALTAVGFYFLADSDWKRALICVIGFIAARVLLVPGALKARE